MAIHQQKSAKAGTPIRPARGDYQKLLNELELCKSELEIQKIKLARSRKLVGRYSEMFNFAPFGYLLLSEEGKIITLNRAAADILGNERSSLKYRSFDFFVTRETRHIFKLFYEKILHSQEMAFCEVRLSVNGTLPFYVHLQGVSKENGKHILMTMVDISISELADQEILDYQNKHKTLFAIEKDSLLLVDNESYRILDVNESACLLYGYTEDEMLKLKNFELSAEPEATKMMRTELIERIELRFHKKKDGTIFPVDITSSIFELRGRSVILAAVRDMSNRVQAENLNLARIHLAEYADNHSLDDILEETLNQAEELTGSEIGFYHFVEPDQKSLILQNWSTKTKRDFCRAEGKGMSYNISQAGVWADCLLTRQPVIHNDYSSLLQKKGLPPGHVTVMREMVIPVIRGGRLVALLGVGNKPKPYNEKDVNIVSLLADFVWDILGRKKAEEILLLSEKKFRTMFNESPFGIALIDSLNGRVYSVNPMFARISGREMEELVTIDWMSITHPDDIQKDLDNMAMLNAGLINKFQMEKRYIRSDGTIVWICMTIAPISTEDKSRPLHLCMIEDITFRKKAEQEIQSRNEELLKINIEKDKFFSIIAHDLRGPISGFLGLTELLSEKLSQLSADEVQQMTFLLKQSATNLFSLLGNLLEWSRMQRGLVSFEPKSYLLKTKLEESLNIVRSMADKKHITTHYELTEDIVVFADGNMLQGILRNLVSNAVKFSHTGGNVTVSAKPVSDQWIKISVKDEGIGMNQHLIDNLFHLNKETNRKGTDGEYSTGLGLILCKEFIEKHGGQLYIESKEGAGSIISFTLPSKSKKAKIN